MNKRMLLYLYDRSGLGAYMPVDLKGHELQVEEHMEKFAELIVRECAEQVDWILAEGGKTQGDLIRKHFGVEEPQGWVCPTCGTDRTQSACPRGHTAALTGDCPMYGVAQ